MNRSGTSGSTGFSSWGDSSGDNPRPEITRVRDPLHLPVHIAACALVFADVASQGIFRL